MKHAVTFSLLAMLCLAGCSGMDPVGRGEEMVRTELYFGLSMPDGKTVTEAQWGAFVDEQITPKFDGGLTVLAARGQWGKKSGEVVKGPARVVVIFHPDTPDAEIAIFNIVNAYKLRFRQKSVLRVRSKAHVRF
jgi:uncharacterized protein DUF3574